MTRTPVLAARRRVTPVPTRRPALVSWTVSVALHIALLGLVSVKPWLMRWPAGMTQPPSDHRKLEQVHFLTMAVRADPATRRSAIGQGLAQPEYTPAELPSDDVGIARENVSEEPATPRKAPVGEAAPLVDAPSVRRPWLTPSHAGDTGARGAAGLLNAFVRAAIAAAADSVKRAKEQEQKAMDWTLKRAGGFRFGISPMRVHLGLLDVPVPVKIVSMRDYDPRSAERRRMEAATREQFTRAVRDSIVSARIRAIRERSMQAGRVPQ